MHPSRVERSQRMVSERNNKVLEAAIAEAQEQGYQFITRDAVAKRAGVSAGGVNNAFGTILELKRAVLREAIRRELLDLVAEGLANKSPVMAEAPPELVAKARQSLG